MRVLLISANSETLYMTTLPLGLNCVAVAARNAGHDVHLLDLMGNGNSASIIRDAIRKHQPHVIGISVRNIDNQNMADTRFLLEPVRDTIALCRSFSGAVIVAGGAGFSIFPEAALRYLKADMGICGEGELAFPALLQALELKKNPSGIAGLCLPGSKVQGERTEGGALGALPLPDPSLWTVPDDVRAEIWVPSRPGVDAQCGAAIAPLQPSREPGSGHVLLMRLYSRFPTMWPPALKISTLSTTPSICRRSMRRISAERLLPPVWQSIGNASSIQVLWTKSWCGRWRRPAVLR